MKSPEVKKAESIIIDTGGSFISFLQDWAMEENPSANRQKSGGISQKGFGAVKTEFLSFTNRLQYVMNKNIIYIFHTMEEKDRDGNVINRLLCEGSAKNLVWQPCDLGCFLSISAAGRTAGFSPTEQYFAKGSFGIKGIVSIPELEEVTPNDFLTKLFAGARESIAQEIEIFEVEKDAYDAAMEKGRLIIENITGLELTKSAGDAIRDIQHALTSAAELKSMFSAKIAELGIKWDKEAKEYVYINGDATAS